MNEKYDKQLEMVRKNGLNLNKVPDSEQTEEMCLVAVKENPNAVKYVAKQTYKVREAAVRGDGYSLKYINKQTPKLREIAVKSNESAILYFDEQTVETITPVLSVMNPYHIFKYIYSDNQTEELILAVLKEYNTTTGYITKEQHTPKVREAILKKDAYFIEKIDDQTEKEQMIALAGGGVYDIFKYFKNPTDKVIKKALKVNAAVLSYVDNDKITDKMIEIALESENNNHVVVKYISKSMLTEEIVLQAVAIRGAVIQYVPAELQTKKVQMAAIEDTARNLAYIVKPKKKVLKRMIKNCPDSIELIKNPSSSLKALSKKLIRKEQKMMMGMHPFFRRRNHWC